MRQSPGVYFLNNIGTSILDYNLDNQNYKIDIHTSLIIVVKNILTYEVSGYLKVNKIGNDFNSIITGGYDPN